VYILYNLYTDYEKTWSIEYSIKEAFVRENQGVVILKKENKIKQNKGEQFK